MALANISKHPNSQRLCVTLKVSEIIVMKALNDFFRFHGPPSLSEAHNMAPRVCADIGEEANMGWWNQVSGHAVYPGPSFFKNILAAPLAFAGWSPFYFQIINHMAFTIKSRLSSFFASDGLLGPYRFEIKFIPSD